MGIEQIVFICTAIGGVVGFLWLFFPSKDTVNKILTRLDSIDRIISEIKGVQIRTGQDIYKHESEKIGLLTDMRSKFDNIRTIERDIKQKLGDSVKERNEIKSALIRIEALLDSLKGKD